MVTCIRTVSRSDQVSAIISERRIPVLPASKTIARSRTASLCTNFWNSSGSSTSLSRNRFCDVLTLLIGLNINHSLRIAWLYIKDKTHFIFAFEAGANARE